MSFSSSVQELVAQSKSDLVATGPNWERVPLGDVVQILNGYPWKSGFFNDRTGAPVIRIRDVTSGTTATRYRGDIVEGFWIEDGDLLVGMDGDFNLRLWAGGRALLNQRVCRIAPDETFYLKSFLAHVLPGYLQLIHDETHSITVKHLSSKTLSEIPVPLPPLNEQRRIVAKIDSLTGKSRRAREHLDHIPRLVEKYKQAVLAAAFSGGFRTKGASYVNELPASEALDTLRREHRVRRTISSGAAPEALFQLPPHWCWATAETVVEPGAEIVYGIVQPGPKLTSGVPYVRGTDIENGRIKLDQLLFTSAEIAARYERASLRSGDVLLGIIRATKVAIVPEELTGGNITQGTARFRPSRLIRTQFLARWLESRTAQSWLHSKYRGIDMPGLNLRDVRQLPVPLPPIEEQQFIEAGIERAFDLIDRFASQATSARRLLDRLDQAVIAKAFRGELVPRDPTDESASTLLGRIMAERAATPKRKRGRKPKTDA